MEDIPLVEDDTKALASHSMKPGGFFVVNFSSMQTLLAAGATLEETCAYLCLAVATDRSNEVSRAGKLSMRRLLGVNDRDVESLLTGLIDKGAVIALEDARRRGPGLLRYRLMRVGTEAGNAELQSTGPAGPSAEIPDPHWNVLIPNSFVRPAGTASSPLQFIQNYGDMTTLWAALRCFHADEPVLLDYASAPPLNDCPRIGPVRLTSFLLPTIADLNEAPGAVDCGLPLDAAGLVDLGLAEVRLHWRRELGSAPQPVAALRGARLDLHTPTAPLALLTFFLGHPEARENRDADPDVAIKIIEMWRTSPVQFAAIPAKAPSGVVDASLHLDNAAETPRGSEDHQVHLDACQRAVSDIKTMIDRFAPDRSALADMLLESAASPAAHIKEKKRRK